MGLSAEPQRLTDLASRGWPAYPVVKGQGFDPSVVKRMAPQVQSVARNVGVYLEGADLTQLHAVKVVAKLGGGGAPGPCGIVPPTAMTPGMSVSIVPLQGSIFVDGVEKGDICTLSEPVAWPLPQGGALLEWTQVVVVGPLPADDAAGAAVPEADAVNNPAAADAPQGVDL